MGQTNSLLSLNKFKRKKSNDDTVSLCKDCENKIQQNTSNNDLLTNSNELYEERLPLNANVPNSVVQNIYNKNNEIVQVQPNLIPRIRHTRSEISINQNDRNNNTIEIGISVSLPTSTSNTQIKECQHDHCYHCNNYYYNQEVYLQGSYNTIIDNNNTITAFHPLPPPPRHNIISSSSSFNDQARPSLSSTSSLQSSSTSSLPIHYHPSTSSLPNQSIKMDKPHKDESSKKILY